MERDSEYSVILFNRQTFQLFSLPISSIPSSPLLHQNSIIQWHCVYNSLDYISSMMQGERNIRAVPSEASSNRPPLIFREAR